MHRTARPLTTTALALAVGLGLAACGEQEATFEQSSPAAQQTTSPDQDDRDGPSGVATTQAPDAATGSAEAAVPHEAPPGWFATTSGAGVDLAPVEETGDAGVLAPGLDLRVTGTALVGELEAQDFEQAGGSLDDPRAQTVVPARARSSSSPATRAPIRRSPARTPRRLPRRRRCGSGAARPDPCSGTAPVSVSRGPSWCPCRRTPHRRT